MEESERFVFHPIPLTPPSPAYDPVKNYIVQVGI